MSLLETSSLTCGSYTDGTLPKRPKCVLNPLIYGLSKILIDRQHHAMHEIVCAAVKIGYSGKQNVI